ncbi:MAG: hypothetical protein CVV58_03050 [Tenericutes bacterium HGW-Tenericutes-3]|nr:MAG: hypothetical protein CVV58_03050 [Tenericutes bacterium HGW-Tenericutes-3]
MKRFLGISLSILFLIVLAGCEAKTSATATFYDVEVFQTALVLSIEVDDPDQEITGTITVNLLKPDGTIANSKQMASEEDYVGITFTALDNTITYTVEVKATVGRNSIVIGTADYTPLTTSIIHITTPEQFLNMNTNRSGNYVLDNDLDFTDVEFTSPFTASFSGYFDGQDYTIRNITFTKIATYTGIFGYVSSGTIKNLNIENVTIGTQAEPLAMITSSRVGILAGYVSSSTASIENISITDSEINYSNSSTVQAYVGAVAGEFRGNLVGLDVDNVEINVTSTSYGKIKIGGAVGLLHEDGRLKEATVNADIHFTMAGDSLKNREIQINVGGVIGDHNARNNNKSVENIASMSNITVDLNFGTSADTTSANYAVYVGGIAGIATSNVLNSFYGGSITVNHQKNDNEQDVVKSIFVGGLFGFYGSNKQLLQVVRLGNGQTIDINVSDDVRLKASQTLGDKASSAVLVIGVYGDLSLNVNSVSVTDTDTSTVYTELGEYFTSDWIWEAFNAVDLPG